jgi:hypothetical protein
MYETRNPQNPPDPFQSFPLINNKFQLPIRYKLRRILCEEDRKALDLAYCELAIQCE